MYMYEGLVKKAIISQLCLQVVLNDKLKKYTTYMYMYLVQLYPI